MPSREPPRFGMPFLLDFCFKRMAERAKLLTPMLVCEALMIEYCGGMSTLLFSYCASVTATPVLACLFLRAVPE